MSIFDVLRRAARHSRTTEGPNCPFCGSDETWEVENSHTRKWMECGKCGACGPIGRTATWLPAEQQESPDA